MPVRWFALRDEQSWEWYGLRSFLGVSRFPGGGSPAGRFLKRSDNREFLEQAFALHGFVLVHTFEVAGGVMRDLANPMHPNSVAEDDKARSLSPADFHAMFRYGARRARTRLDGRIV